MQGQREFSALLMSQNGSFLNSFLFAHLYLFFLFRYPLPWQENLIRRISIVQSTILITDPNRNMSRADTNKATGSTNIIPPSLHFPITLSPLPPTPSSHHLSSSMALNKDCDCFLGREEVALEDTATLQLKGVNKTSISSKPGYLSHL